jgi:hypothetical protein
MGRFPLAGLNGWAGAFMRFGLAPALCRQPRDVAVAAGGL